MSCVRQTWQEVIHQRVGKGVIDVPVLSLVAYIQKLKGSSATDEFRSGMTRQLHPPLARGEQIGT